MARESSGDHPIVAVVGCHFCEGGDRLLEHESDEGFASGFWFIPDPTNEHDPDAVKVMWHEHHVGYIPISTNPGELTREQAKSLRGELSLSPIDVSYVEGPGKKLRWFIAKIVNVVE